MSPKGRHAKSKARINAYEEMLGQNQEKESKTHEIFIAPGPRLGDLVIEAQNVNKAYGDNLLGGRHDFYAAARRHRRYHRSQRGG
jgi:sulfate-transporting ATPase